MYLYLVRHGDAVTAAENPERPLSQYGRQSVERTASLAFDRKIRVSVIYHSGILRAQQTAEIFAELFEPPRGLQQRSGLLPDDDPALLRAEIAGGEQPLMLVGHLPYLNRLAALLEIGDPDRTVIDFLPAMMVCFAEAKGQWKIDWTLARDGI